MKIFMIFFVVLFCNSSSAQEIRGALMANDKGITENPKDAKYLIVIKEYGDSAYERLDYGFAGPMQTRITFMDSTLKIANGKYAAYSSSGYLAEDGNCLENKKEGIWYIYDDTSHAIIKQVYHLDSLVSVINLDSMSKEKGKIHEDTTDQIEAVYNGGNRKILKIIQSNFVVPDRTSSLTKGGTTKVRFVINTSGKPIDIEILKSTEFSFDEEAKRVVGLLNDWVPASDKGKKVNAYRIQPVTVTLE